MNMEYSFQATAAKLLKSLVALDKQCEEAWQNAEKDSAEHLRITQKFNVESHALVCDFLAFVRDSDAPEMNEKLFADFQKFLSDDEPSPVQVQDPFQVLNLPYPGVIFGYDECMADIAKTLLEMNQAEREQFAVTKLLQGKEERLQSRYINPRDYDLLEEQIRQEASIGQAILDKNPALDEWAWKTYHHLKPTLENPAPDPYSDYDYYDDDDDGPRM